LEKPKCRAHLPDGKRRTLLRQLGKLRYLGRFEVGDLVELAAVCELLCDINGCSQELRASYEEELRSAHLAQKARNNQLSKMSLADYLRTYVWRVKRNCARIRSGNRCQICASTHRLDVHHRTYERLDNELLSDLVVLCRRCHQYFHDVLPNCPGPKAPGPPGRAGASVLCSQSPTTPLTFRRLHSSNISLAI
jgi:hypothetical protein